MLDLSWVTEAEKSTVASHPLVGPKSVTFRACGCFDRGGLAHGGNRFGVTTSQTPTRGNGLQIVCSGFIGGCRHPAAKSQRGRDAPVADAGVVPGMNLLAAF